MTGYGLHQTWMLDFKVSVPGWARSDNKGSVGRLGWRTAADLERKLINLDTSCS